MCIRKTCKSIVIYVLSAMLVLSASIAVPALETQASSAGSAGSLIGSGAANEINILRILDMALNKSGIVMSSGTIRSFLEFWWSNVRSDIQTIIGDADTTITTVSDFIKWVESNWTSTEKPKLSKVAEISLRFLKYCALQESKTLSDYKQLITQEGTFREFLLSYVTDGDGNLAGSVNNNKLAKYNLKSGLISMARQAADAYIDEHEGYYLVKTHKPSDLPASSFTWKSYYDGVTGILKKMKDNQIFFVGFSFSSPNSYYRFYDFTDYGFVSYRNTSSFIEVNVYDSNWSTRVDFGYSLCVDGTFAEVVSSSESYNQYRILFNNPFSNSVTQGWLYTLDGRTVKVWKTLDAFKNSSVGKSDIYYSKDYSDFEESKDTGLTFTGAYYNSSYSHETVQNTIDNSQTTVDNSVVNNIVNNYITNNYYGDGSGSGDSEGDDKPGGWWNIGEGISSFIEGIAALLDFILKLLGDLVGLLSKFLTSVLDVLSGLTALGQGFGDFLGAIFTFLPEECTSLIVSSIAAMCVVGVVKSFMK